MLWAGWRRFPRRSGGRRLDAAAERHVRVGTDRCSRYGAAVGESFVNVDERTVGTLFPARHADSPGARLFSEDTGTRLMTIDDHMAQWLWPREDSPSERLRRGMDADANARG